jgi:hypothetical protein
MRRPPHHLRVGLCLVALAACGCHRPADVSEAPTASSATGPAADTRVDSPIDFARDVRPLLNTHCTACHGGVKKAGGISFLARETSATEGDSGEHAIVPGDPAASEMLRRVASGDDDERMPPPDHGRALAPAEIDILRRWIAGGAEWRAHWSFEPPVDSPAPAVKAAAWPRVPFDAFVAARLDAEGLAPSPPASPAEWLRRVALDLTGLPPTIEDYDAFLADGGGGTDPAAVRAAQERQVDRLLASSHFGERWASVWLDLARYADTFGFEKDPERSIWPWRDWVIRAFNDDMPFDRFTVRQLAGDLLPHATADDILATAFHRNTQTNTEGGTDDEEYRTAAVLDRVNTTWTAWQGTTFGCVQCHAHPYDPFPHTDYYRFAAFFNQSEDCDLDSEYPRFPVPADPTARDALAAAWHDRRVARHGLNAEGAALAGDTRWEPVVLATATTTGGTIEITGPGTLRAGGTLPVGVKYQIEAELPPGTTALRLDLPLDCGREESPVPERGAVISHVEISLPPAELPATPPPAASQAEPEAATDGKPPAAPAPPQRIPVNIVEVIGDSLGDPFDPMDALTAGHGGFGNFPAGTRPRWCVLVFDDPQVVADGCGVRIMLAQAAAANAGQQGCPIRRLDVSASADPRWTALVHSAPRQEKWRQVREWDKSLAAKGSTTVPVMRDRPGEARRATRVFIRGNRLECGDAVEPGVPAVTRPPETMPTDRLGMAEWLVGPSNPLAARVFANRLWAEMFGTGIVETLEDFGSSGAPASHPELLDHLAVRLVRDHQWSVKKLLREIALSATYGQTAAAAPALVARDPRNRLLARGPRNRLTAEMVRDQALVWSGLLVPTLFGPPVFPPQPDGIWKSAYSGATWKTSTGSDRFRRSIYTFVKRTAGYPALLAFDAPSRDLCSARRFPTNTPLQPLVTLNDPMFMELAAGMAARMEGAGENARDRIAFGCRLATLEPPAATMLDALEGLHASAVAEGKAERDALAVVAAAILNLDLALVR